MLAAALLSICDDIMLILCRCSGSACNHIRLAAQGAVQAYMHAQELVATWMNRKAL